MRQNGQLDGRMFRDSERELSTLFEEQVTVKVWTGTTSGNPAAGVIATDTYRIVPTRANISDLSASEVFRAASDYAVGDLQIELRVPVYGSISVTGQDGQTAPRKSDRVLYRGREYYFVGHIHQQKNAGHTAWVAHMRPTGA